MKSVTHTHIANKWKKKTTKSCYYSNKMVIFIFVNNCAATYFSIWTWMMVNNDAFSIKHASPPHYYYVYVWIVIMNTFSHIFFYYYYIFTFIRLHVFSNVSQLLFPPSILITIIHNVFNSIRNDFFFVFCLFLLRVHLLCGMNMAKSHK